MSLRAKLAPVFKFGINAAAAVLCLASAIVGEPIWWRVLFVLGALGGALAAAIQIPSVRRYAERNAKS